MRIKVDHPTRPTASLLAEAASFDRPMPDRLLAYEELLGRRGSFAEAERFEFERARADLFAALAIHGPATAGRITYRAEGGKIVASLPREVRP